MKVFATLFSLFLAGLLTSSSAVASSSIPLTNFHAIENGLFRGARPTAQGLNDLKQLGVKTIVDLQGGDLTNPHFHLYVKLTEPGEFAPAIAAEKSTVENLGMNFVNIPLDAFDKVTPAEAQAIDALLKFMADPKNQPIFIHCEHGADRTGLVAALYRVYYQQWTPQAAHDEMVALGHNTFHSIFTDDLDDYFWTLTLGN